MLNKPLRFFRRISVFLTVLVSLQANVFAESDKITVHSGKNSYASGQFYSPSGLSYAENRGLLVADAGGNCVRLITAGKVETFAGKPAQPGGYVDGRTTDAMFNNPLALAVARDGTVYVCDTENSLIRRIHGGFVDTAAGNGKHGYADGSGIAASFNKPAGVDVSEDGTVYIADTLNHCIRKMDSAGNVTLYAGIPGNSGNADGSLSQAKFFEPAGIAVAKNGALYIADSANHSIRKIENGFVSTIAGKPGVLNSETGYFSGGFRNGYEPLFNFPKGIAVAGDGFVYVADTYNHAVRRISPDGSVITIIGNGEPGKLYGNYKNAKLSRPYDVAVFGQTLYVSDNLNDTVLELPINDVMTGGLPTREELIRSVGVSQYSKEISVYFNKELINLSSKPVKTYDDFTLPLSEFFAAIGAKVDFDASGKTITVEKGAFKTALVNGEHFVLESGVYSLNVNVLVNNFPYIVEWYPEYNVLVVEE